MALSGISKRQISKLRRRGLKRLFETVSNGHSQRRTLIDSSFVYGSITFILIVVFLASALIFTGVGFLIKSIQSTGAVRQRFAFLSIGFIVFVICGALDSLVAPGLGLIIVRGGMICYAWFMYFGLKTA